jgi:hypothetical protein
MRGQHDVVEAVQWVSRNQKSGPEPYFSKKKWRVAAGDGGTRISQYVDLLFCQRLLEEILSTPRIAWW